MAPKLIQWIKFLFSLTAGARFRWIKNKSVPHSSSVFACRRGRNTCAPSIVYRLLIGWNCHTTWSQGNLHYMRLHFLKLDREFFCLQPSLARLYSAAASLAITVTINLPLGETDNNMGQVCQLFRSVGHSSNVMYQCDFKITKFCRDTNGATLFIRIFCCFVLYKAEDIVNKKI